MNVSLRHKFTVFLSIMFALITIHFSQAQLFIGEGIMSLAWNPSGTLLAGAMSDGTISVWDEDSNLIQSWAGHQDIVYDVAWSPTGNQLASGGGDGFLNIWDTSDWSLQVSRETPNDSIMLLDWNPDPSKHQLASLYLNLLPNLLIWDTLTWEVIERPSVQGTSINWDTSGTQIVTGGSSFGHDLGWHKL